MEKHENAVESPTRDVVPMHLIIARQVMGPFNLLLKRIIKLENKLHNRSDAFEEREINH